VRDPKLEKADIFDIWFSLYNNNLNIKNIKKYFFIRKKYERSKYNIVKCTKDDKPDNAEISVI